MWSGFLFLNFLKYKLAQNIEKYTHANFSGHHTPNRPSTWTSCSCRDWVVMVVVEAGCNRRRAGGGGVKFVASMRSTKPHISNPVVAEALAA
jgi:hypothetical protein